MSHRTKCHRLRARSAAVACALFLAACGDDDSPADAGSDSGIVDAGDIDGGPIDSGVEDASDDASDDGAIACATECGACERCAGGECVAFGAFGTGVSVAGGWDHAFAIDADGALFAWGANNTGQLGVGDTADRDVGIEVAPGSRWVQVAGGSRHSCGVRDDGTLWCWGTNVHGQLGVGDTADRDEPAQVGTATTWARVACGGLHTCALDTAGHIWCFGANPAGQLGLGAEVTGDQPTPQQVPGDTVWTDLTARTRHTCAIASDGSLWCWGDDSDGQLGLGDVGIDRHEPTEVAPGTTWRAVRAGALHTCAIDDAGALWCWGANDTGQLGLGDSEPRLVPTRVGDGTDWLDANGGFSHTCALRGAFALWCWGDAMHGELGLGDTTRRLVPTEVTAMGATSGMTLGIAHTCALSSSGDVRCFGAGARGQRASGDLAPSADPAAACYAN